MVESKILTKELSEYASRFPFIEAIKGKSVIVTGATGLIGSLLIKCLLEVKSTYGIEIKIIGLARNPGKIESIFGSADVEWISDFNLEKGELPENLTADYLIHCAAPTSSAYFVTHPVETYLTTLNGTNALLELVKNRDMSAMVYLSSLEYYGTIHDDRDVYENDLGYIDPYDVRSSYSLGKRAAESLCHAYYKEYAVPVKVARLTQVFGPGVSESDNRVFAQFARSVIKGQDIELHTEGKSSKPYCYTIDAVDAIFHILFKGKAGEAYNVANPDTYTSIRDFAEMAQRRFNPARDVIVKLDSTKGYAPDTKLKLNVDKLKGLGWRPRYSLPGMFENLIEYLKEIN